MKTETFFSRLLRFIYLFFTLGLIRGLIGQALGLAVGYGLVTVIRDVQGLEKNSDLAIT